MQKAGDALEDESRQKWELQTANQELKDENRNQKLHIVKLENHIKICEKAFTKAQDDTKDAMNNADRMYDRLKGVAKAADLKYKATAQNLKDWTERYGNQVEKPAEEKNALQLKVSEWQMKAEKAQNEIASLEEKIQKTPKEVGLHQALGQWEENQGCSAEVADLEDKLDDRMRLSQKLESDLKTSIEQHQKTKSDMEALQIKADKLEQANKAFEGFQVKADQLQSANRDLEKLQVKADQLEQVEKDYQELRVKVDHLEQVEKDYQELRVKVDHLESASRDLEELQIKADQLEQIKKDYQELQVKADQLEQIKKDYQELQDKADQLEHANETLQDQDKTREYLMHIQKLESDLRKSSEHLQEIEGDMNALQEKLNQTEEPNGSFRGQEKIDVRMPDDDMQGKENERVQLRKSNMALKEEVVHLEEANKVLQFQDSSYRDSLESLELDLKASKEKFEGTESEKNKFQRKADQLESELKILKDQHQKTESEKKTLQESADQLKSNLESSKEQHQITKSEMEVLQEKVDQLEQDKKPERLRIEALEEVGPINVSSSSLDFPYSKHTPCSC